MDRERLKNADATYFKIDVRPVDAIYSYTNMKALVTFIGLHYPHNKWDALGNAYYELRKRTNTKLKSSSWLYRGKLKTSKSEIKAFVSAKRTRDTKTVQMRIPYKSYQIMESIVDCIDELMSRKIEIPPELRPLCGELYRFAFMKRQVELYESIRRSKKKEWQNLDFIAWYLHDDFMSEDSPFNKSFCK